MRIAIPNLPTPTTFATRNPAAAIHHFAGETMATRWSLHLASPTPVSPQRDIQAEFDAIVAEMSQWQPASALSRYNRAAPGWHPLPPRLADVLATALDLAADTDGAFDPTIGALADRWGFGPSGRPAAPPDARESATLLVRTGWRRIAFDRAARRAHQPGGVALDFSGIAKGYAVDRIAALLHAQGHHDFLIEVGGELVGAGLRPDGQPWWVDVEDPPGAGLPPLRVALHEMAIATSGDWRRFYDHDGRTWPHSIDPRTGRPVTNGVASVTVIHRHAIHADALATALTVMGIDDGLAYAEPRGIAARFVVRAADGFAETLTPALQAMIDE